MTVDISSDVQAKLARLNIQATRDIPQTIQLSKDTTAKCFLLFFSYLCIYSPHIHLLAHNLLAKALQTYERCVQRIEEDPNSVETVCFLIKLLSFYIDLSSIFLY